MPTRAVARHGDADPLSVAIPWLGVAAPALSLRGVRKSFGSLPAGDRIALEVPAGISFRPPWANGPGKSTTMRMLPAQAIADEGEIEVLGYRVPEQSKEA